VQVRGLSGTFAGSGIRLGPMWLNLSDARKGHHILTTRNRFQKAFLSIGLIAGIAAGPITGTATHTTPASPHRSPAVTAHTVATPSTQDLMPTGVPTDQSTIGLSDEQKANAAAIVKASQDMHLPPRAAVIAVATSMQETKLHNYGDLGATNDHDSLGLFQQRPSSGWGSAQQLTDPHYATTAFLKSLTQQPDWQHKPLTDAAQTVQVSAFGDRYAQWEKQAADLVQADWTR
jgi:hypothetical protein